MDPVTAILLALLGGGFVTAVAAYRKVGPEKDQIAVTTMEAVVRVAREELQLCRQEIGELRREHADDLIKRDEVIAGLRERIRLLEENCVNRHPGP